MVLKTHRSANITFIGANETNGSADVLMLKKIEHYFPRGFPGEDAVIHGFLKNSKYVVRMGNGRLLGKS